MNLRPKIIALITTVLVTLGVAQYLIQERILQPSFTALEQQWVSNEMARAALAIDRQVDLLDVYAGDWGDWSEMYRYMGDRNPAFTRESASSAEIAALNIDMVALVDLNGRFVWSYASVPGPGDPTDLDLIHAGGLPADIVWQNALHNNTAVRGVMGTNRGPLVVAAGPIFNGRAEGPSRGLVLLGRFLTPARIATIGEQAQTALTIPAYRKPGEPMPELIPAAAQQVGDEHLLLRDQVAEAYRMINDVNGQPLLSLKVAVPRMVSARGRQVIAEADGFLALVAATIVLLLVVALHFAVVKPIRKLTQRAAQIGNGVDLDVPLDLHRTDELGQLSQEIERIAKRTRAQSEGIQATAQRPGPGS